MGGQGPQAKGASDQTTSIATADEVTSVGNIVLKQWQKLPTRLLSNLLKKNNKLLRKGLPIYYHANNNNGWLQRQRQSRRRRQKDQKQYNLLSSDRARHVEAGVFQAQHRPRAIAVSAKQRTGEGGSDIAGTSLPSPGVAPRADVA